MVDDDPLKAEFAALPSALLIRPPGADAARRTVRRRRHRAIASASVLAVLAVVALGLGSAGYVRRPPRTTAAVNPSAMPSPTPASPHPVAPTGAPSSARTRTGTTAPTTTVATGVPCHRYGAALLDTTTSSSVSVGVDQKGLYPLCPGERVRVFVATYSVDSNGVQHLFRSQVGYLDPAHNPITLTYQAPPCHAIIYVMSGNQTIKQTIPATDNLYQDGPLVYGSPQWGPYNGQVWLHEQDPCGTT